MKHIMILGGGYAGVSAAVRLRGIKAAVTLVNHHSYHHLTTLLHQPVVGRREYRDLSLPLRDVLPRPVRFQRGKVLKIVPQENRIEMQTREGRKSLTCDIMIIALGWQPQFFNIPGLREYGLTLDSLNASRLVHDRIEESLIAFDENPEEKWRTSIIVAGGGLSGVELMGELADSRAELARAFDLQPKDIKLCIIEGSHGLLHGLDSWLAEQAAVYLREKQVECIANTRIAEGLADGVVLSDGTKIQAGVVIWTGGVRGNMLVEESGLEVNREGRAIVNEFLQPRGYDNIFVLGDCAAATGGDGTFLPPTAQLAVQQGEWVACALNSLIKGDKMEPYHPRMEGILLSIGRSHALGIVRGHHVTGKVAGMLKDFIAYRYIYKIGGFSLALRKFREWRSYSALLRRR
ncbi:MAG: NAD(P)/FAD-dependent oxidoreductase [Desulfobulbaceae bacterium]|nr:NAD(P)/FAD-dependent oxidoreductase [Desulfobulbaceae bacterium]